MKKVFALLLVLFFFSCEEIFKDAPGNPDNPPQERPDEGEEVFDGFPLGSTGPAGGIIFYDHVLETGEEHPDGWRYLESAPLSFAHTLKTTPSVHLMGENISIVPFEPWKQMLPRTLIYSNLLLESGIGRGKISTQFMKDSFPDRQNHYSHSIPATRTFPAQYIYVSRNHKVLAQEVMNLAFEHNNEIFQDWFIPSKDEMQALWMNVFSDGSEENQGLGLLKEGLPEEVRELMITGKNLYTSTICTEDKYKAHVLYVRHYESETSSSYTQWRELRRVHYQNNSWGMGSYFTWPIRSF